MRATMILADHVQVAEGKLNVLGGGWTWINPGTVTFGVGLLVEVPWDRLNQRHQIQLELVDADGNAVTAQGPDGEERPVLISGEFEGGRAPGHTPGTPLMMPNALMVQGVTLQPAQRYRWQLSINGESHEDWVLAFSTRSAPNLAQGQVG
jgi:hypothetical protein